MKAQTGTCRPASLQLYWRETGSVSGILAQGRQCTNQADGHLIERGKKKREDHAIRHDRREAHSLASFFWPKPTEGSGGRGGEGGHLIENVVQQVFAARLGLFSGVNKEGYDCIPHASQLQAVTLYAVYLEEEGGRGVVELFSTPGQHHLRHPYFSVSHSVFCLAVVTAAAPAAESLSACCCCCSWHC